MCSALEEPTFLLGADIELFVIKAKESIKPASLILGDKNHKKPISRGGRLFNDGIPLEFNVKQSTCREIMIGQINDNLKDIKEELSEKNFRLSYMPYVKFKKSTWDSISDKDKEIGCDPDYNIYTGIQNDKSELKNIPARCVGGHIHLGTDLIGGLSLPYLRKVYIPYMRRNIKINFTNVFMDENKDIKLKEEMYNQYYRWVKKYTVPPSRETVEKTLKTTSLMPYKTSMAYKRIKTLLNKEELIPLMDIFAGNLSVGLTRVKDVKREKERRTLYGRAGDYRQQPHGIEYRVLSSNWMRNEVKISLILGYTRAAANILLYEKKALLKDIKNTFDLSNIQDTINNVKRKKAIENFDKLIALLKKHEIIREDNTLFKNRVIARTREYMVNPLKFEKDHSLISSPFKDDGIYGRIY